MATQNIFQGSWGFLPSEKLYVPKGEEGKEGGDRHAEDRAGMLEGMKGRTTPKMCEIYCMLNCWLCGGQYCKNVSTSTRSSFCSSSPKCSTWFCKSSTDTRQPSVSPVPSLSTRHMMRAASLGREGRTALGRPRLTHHSFIHSSSSKHQCLLHARHSVRDFYQDASCSMEDFSEQGHFK